MMDDLIITFKGREYRLATDDVVSADTRSEMLIRPSDGESQLPMIYHDHTTPQMPVLIVLLIIWFCAGVGYTLFLSSLWRLHKDKDTKQRTADIEATVRRVIREMQPPPNS